MPGIDQRYIQLPLLEVLEELGSEAMWFPVAFNERRGFLYQLDGRELMVRAVGLDVGTASGDWRISIEGAKEVQQLLSVDDKPFDVEEHGFQQPCSDTERLEHTG